MTWFYFWTLAAMVAALFALALRQPARALEFPCFMGATFGVFILPQALSLIRFPGPAPASAVPDVLLMSCLCLAACLAGYRAKPWGRLIHAASRPIDESRLFHVGLVFVGCGFFFQHLLSETDVQFSENGGMTGLATIYLFFAELAFAGFAICLFAALRRRTLGAILAALVAGIIPLQAIAIGRREPAAIFALTIGLGLFFWRGLKPPRWALVLAVIFATLALPATGTYRGLQNEKDWDGVRQMNLVANFNRFIGQESILELRNGAILIHATRENSAYQYGAAYWNHLVFRFVPAQFLGADFKQSLMFQNVLDAAGQAEAQAQYDIPIGSTITGMGDSFQQFGWFGCLFFAGMAILFRSLWHAANDRRAVFAQLLYMSVTTSAMRAVTHWTLDFLPGLLYHAVFLGLAFLYARVPQPRPWMRPRKPPRAAWGASLRRESSP
jgi:hypothetical protein